MLANTILESLKDEISDEEYKRYISRLKFDENSSDNDNVVFIAPSPILANWIKTKYSTKIAKSYEKINKNRPKVFIITDNKKREIVKKSSNKSVKNTPENSSTILNPSYTFDSFVVGSSNQYAYTVSTAIVRKPNKTYNPLFIYGPTGLGKTHLIQAIGNEALRLEKSIIYTTSEQFMNDFIYNVKNQTMERFRKKYRNCDFLLIDDVQFFSDKIQTQEEFFHTFNELHENKKQIVLTSDTPPKMIAGLEERLKSRFEWGLITDITYPELETKIAIIKKKCELDGIDLNEEIINYIATNMGDNIREIESAIINLNAYASLMRQEINLEFAKNVLKEQIKQKRENIEIEDIINVVSKDLNVKKEDIKSKKRTKNIVNARRIVIYLARDLTPNSMPTIASYLI